jgi:hypothetical protein
VRLVAVLAAAAVVLPGCGGGGSDDEPVDSLAAGVYMSALVRKIANGEYDEAWQSLYPPHQRVARRDAYVTCESRDHIPSRVAEIRVLKVVDEEVEVAGESRTEHGAAITMRLRVGEGDFTDSVVDVFHAVAVDGGWAWILPEARYEAYRAGRCPGSAPSSRA